MSDMKCPVCNVLLDECGDLLCCPNDHCAWVGNKELWQELIRTRKALDVAKTHLGYIKNNYHSWTPYRDEQMIAQASNCLAKIQELEDGNL
jgi:hypothetical protein